MTHKIKRITHLATTYILLAFSLCFSLLSHAGEDTKRVVMVLSGYGENGGETKPGYEFDEFAKAYLVFKQNNVGVDIASPQGGSVEADKYDPSKGYNAKVLADKSAMSKLNNTLAISALKANQYDGIFVVGGKGAMFDLPNDKALQQLIADIYQTNGTVAAVCHGPAALVDVKLSDGSYLVEDKAINSFTNEEEKLFGKKWIKSFDFMLEDKLKSRGAQFQSSDIMLNHVAVDQRLITGQNPTSTVAVATELVRSLGITPAPATMDAEDKTLALVAQFIDGDTQALSVLKESPADYHIALVGMYGFYYEMLADSTKEHENALALMLSAQKTLNNPRLDLKIAQTQHKLGQSAQAKTTLEALLANKPDFQPAVEMLKTLSM